MTRCRWTDRIADTVADPAGGVGALTAEEHAHIGRCAECFSTVERLVHLDRALTGELRSLERGELPRSVLATPPYERRSRPPVLPVVLGGLAVAAAVLVVVVGSGLARTGLSWIGSSTGSPAPSIVASPSLVPSTAPSVEPTPAPAPGAAALEVGAIAAVVDEPLVVRTSPGATDASTITDDRLWIGQRVRLLEGPVEADGYPWWRVRVGEIEGWISAEEKDGSAPWISPIANGPIAFEDFSAGAVGRDQPWSLIEPDGSGRTPFMSFDEQGIRLVYVCPMRASATWASDGSFLLVSGQLGCGEPRLSIVDADGGEIIDLPALGGAVLSPNGRQVAYAPGVPFDEDCFPGCGSPGDPPREILVGPSDGSLEPVAWTSNDPGFVATQPAWSPDGTSIAYSGFEIRSDALDRTDPMIYVANQEGQRRITAGINPVWSPDGRWIVFQRPDTYDLYRIRIDGTEEGVLARGAFPQFSPDGASVMYQALDIAGSGTGTVIQDWESGDTRTVGGAETWSAVWSPDGTMVSYNGLATGNVAILVVVDADGANPRQIAEGGFPAWQPLLTDRRLTSR